MVSLRRLGTIYTHLEAERCSPFVLLELPAHLLVLEDAGDPPHEPETAETRCDDG